LTDSVASITISLVSKLDSGNIAELQLGWACNRANIPRRGSY